MNSDEELLQAWRDGDRQAGGALFNRHFEIVRRFVANKVDDEVEDIVQRTFMAAVEGRDRFAGRSTFRTYVLGIALNMVRKHWSQGSKRQLDDIDKHPIAQLGAGPSSLLVRSETERLLLAALRQIPLGDQALLELYYWENLKAREIGEILGIPENSVRSRIRRAKLALAKELRRLERFAGMPETTDEDLDAWARKLHGLTFAPK